ncbi:MAG: choice-of-anchor D domain-containing protein [Desulfobacteraceae bacterium]|nr:choice-of-anchor D domain-containing protein [Desulfobacteraceae bacterium]
MMVRTYDGSSWSDYKVISLNSVERFSNESYSVNGNGSLSAVAWSGKYNGQGDIFLSYSKNSSLPQSIALNAQVLSTTAPFSVKFTVDAQSPVTGYKYLFGNGDTQSSSLNTVTYSYKEAGTYTVSVVATNSNGTTSTATTSITVGQPLHPKISVKQGSTEIADGGSFSVESAKTGSYSDTTFTINNIGNANLTIGNVSETSGDFEIIETPLPVVAPGNQTSFTVRFQPGTAGDKTAVIQFANNDDFGKNPFNFTVKATAFNPPSAPEIEVRHGSTVIPNQGTYPMQNILAVGSSQDMPFTFYNTGNATLTIGTISESSSDFSILQQPTDIAAGQSVNLVVQYKPLTAGSKSLTLQFKTNDADENPFSFTITGKAVANQPPAVSITSCPSGTLTTSSYTSMERF